MSEDSAAIPISLLSLEIDLEKAFARLADSGPSTAKSPPFKIVIPGEKLGDDSLSLASLLTSMLAEFEDIERVLQGLQEEPAAPEEKQTIEDAVAVVSSHELQDPQALSKVLEPLQSEAARFELLFRHAKAELDHLDIYRLSRMAPDDLMGAIRRRQRLDSLQSLVVFLRTLARAADSFEALELPRPHIRDYLRHLYLMKDWNEMARLVRLLEVAVAEGPPSSS